MWMRFAFVALLPCALAAAVSFDPWKDAARYDFDYRVDLAAIPAQSEQRVRLWAPAPSTTPHQDVHASRIHAPFAHRESVDSLGNRMVYLEWTGPAPAGAELRMQFNVTRRPSRDVPPSAAGPGTLLDPKNFLHADRRVPLDGAIGKLGAQHAEGRATPEAKVRAFYDYVLRSMRYSKEGTGWGQGDAIWACNAKYGNCTDFHSLLIGMARSQGIPARFVIGFPIAAQQTEFEVPGYHCWAEWFDPVRGWRPLDASEAWKSKLHEQYFGALPSDRIEFTSGRDLELEPPQEGDVVNYFIYPYAEVGGKPVQKVSASFRVRRRGIETADGR
jgi:transglutaminase-like putative cysteine protease